MTAIVSDEAYEPDAVLSELMARVALQWPALSVMNAFERAGVMCPMSGDALRLQQVPYRPEFYNRQRAIEEREQASRMGLLW